MQCQNAQIVVIIFITCFPKTYWSVVSFLLLWRFSLIWNSRKFGFINCEWELFTPLLALEDIIKNWYHFCPPISCNEFFTSAFLLFYLCRLNIYFNWKMEEVGLGKVSGIHAFPLPQALSEEEDFLDPPWLFSIMSWSFVKSSRLHPQWASHSSLFHLSQVVQII